MRSVACPKARTQMPKDIKITARYKLQNFIGQGKFTTVYQVYDNQSGEQRALQLFHELYIVDNPIFLKQLKHKFGTIQQLSHPNIVKYYELGETDEQPYIVMEYLEGITLKQLLAYHDGKIPAKIAVSILEQVLSGLSYLHHQRVVHLNINPSAIFIKSNGEVKLADFYIAESIPSLDNKKVGVHQGEQVELSRYVAPEQLLDKSAGFQSDVFSVGVIFYEMITGELPFLQEKYIRTDMRAWAKLRPPSDLIGDIAKGFDQFTLTALKFNPEDRFTDADDMLVALSEFPKAPLSDLADWASGRKLPIRKDPPPDPTSRRRYFIIGIIFAFIAFALLVLGPIRKLIFSPIVTPTETIIHTLVTTPTTTIIPTTSISPTQSFTSTPTITPLPTLTPSTLPAVFADDFSDPQKTAEQWKQVSGDWDSTTGIYTCQKVDDACLSLENQDVTSDFVLSVDILGDVGTDKAVYLGFVENQKNFTILLRSDPINQIQMIKHIEGQPDVVIAEVAFELKNNVWYRVNIQAIQNSLKIIVNEQQILDLAIDTPSDLYGQIGLGIPLSSNNGSVASFDNFIVTIPNVTPHSPPIKTPKQ